MIKRIHFIPILQSVALVIWTLPGIFASSPSPVSAAGSSWTSVSSPVSRSLATVWGSSSNNVYAGGNGVMLHFDGSSWNVIPNRCNVYQAITGSSANDIAAVGLGGPIERFTGSSWQKNPGWVSGDQYGLRSIGANNYVAVGDSWGLEPNGPSSPIMRMQNGTWDQVPSSNAILDSGWSYATSLKSVWSASASSIWAAGENDTGNGPVIYHWDGTTWNNQFKLTDSSPGIVGIWGSSANNVWAVAGDKGTNGASGRRLFYHFDGAQWSPVVSYTVEANGNLGQMPRAIWGNAANDIWVVGDNALGSSFMHYDGTAWGAVAGPSQAAGETFRSVWGSSANDVWAVGDNGHIVHFGVGGQSTISQVTGTETCTGTANAAPTVDVTLSSPTITKPGGLAVLTWRTTLADSLQIDGVPLAAPSGQRQYFLTDNHTFTIKACISATNNCATTSAAVTMIDGISVTLAVDPVSGVVPVGSSSIPTTLTATASVTSAAAPITYYFYCNRSDAGTNIQPAPDASFGPSTSLSQAMASCAYGPGTYTAKVIAVQSGIPAAEGRVVVVRTAPTLTATLAATPSSGTEPTTSTLLATVGGTNTGPITYTFYCHRADVNATVIPGWSNQVVDTDALSQSTSCTYPTHGSYHPTVIIQRGGLTVQAYQILPVSQISYLSATLTATPSTTPSGVGVSLKASVSGVATGPINYYFYCSPADYGSSVTDDYDYAQLGVTAASLTMPANALCIYNDPSGASITVKPKVIVTRGGYTYTTLASITVQPADLSIILSASSSSGIINFTPTLSAAISGSLSGQFAYSWFCDTSVAAPTVTGTASTSPIAQQCTYSQSGIYTAKLVIVRDGVTRFATTSITAKNPTISSFSANPASGSAPLHTALIAQVDTGSLTGNSVNYYFYCNPTDQSATITPGYDHSVTGSNLLTAEYSLGGGCFYPDGGTYKPKVVVQVGSLAPIVATATLNLGYPATPLPPDLDFKVNNSYNPIVPIGSLLNFSWTPSGSISSLAASPNWQLPSSTQFNCPVGSCPAAAIANKLGDQVYSLTAASPGGAITKNVTVKIVPAPTSKEQTNYNYSKGG